jgi:hypothetical protein
MNDVSGWVCFWSLMGLGAVCLVSAAQDVRELWRCSRRRERHGVPQRWSVRVRWDYRLAPARRWWRRVRGQDVAPCAWCLAERGKRARAGDSHGICRAHARGLLAEANGRRSRVAM